MEKTKRIYPATQLIVALDAKILKVYLWIISWSASQGNVKYYSKQFAKACKMEEDEVERCIQSLKDARLVDISKVDQTWILTPNAEQNQKYYDIPISKVLEGNGIMMADKVTWNAEEEQLKQGSKFDSMSDDELKRLLLMIEASLNERQQVKNLIKSNEPIDLPF